MKNPLHVLIMTIMLLPLLHQNLNSQTIPTKRPTNYRTYVKSMDNSICNGYLTLLKDSFIIVAKYTSNEKNFFKVEDINNLQFKKGPNLGQGLFVGALAGFAIGSLIGIAIGDDKNAGGSFFKNGGLYAKDKAKIIGVISIFPGALIGAMASSATIKITINGNQDNYNSQRAELEKYKYKY